MKMLVTVIANVKAFLHFLNGTIEYNNTIITAPPVKKNFTCETKFRNDMKPDFIHSNVNISGHGIAAMFAPIIRL